jgi:electron transport complex protein RnfD
MENKLLISYSPHIHQDRATIKRIMLDVIIALIPALLMGLYLFGVGALIVTTVSVVSAVFWEWAITKFLLHREPRIWDLSAVVTGLLLAMNVPSNLPVWMIIVGTLVAIGIGKMSFGGIGQNIFNPALVGRVFLLISFPVAMTSWPVPIKSRLHYLNAITGPTALGTIKEGIKEGKTIAQLMPELPSHMHMFLGLTGGSLGEMAALLLILGGIYLLIRRVITWHIPTAIIGTVFIFGLILWLINPQRYPDPLFQILSGGVMLGAIFMATDYVTSPMTGLGKIIFGIAIGILIIVIREWGSYPEGVSFAILIMNAFVPLIDQATKPKVFGTSKSKKS